MIFVIFVLIEMDSILPTIEPGYEVPTCLLLKILGAYEKMISN